MLYGETGVVPGAPLSILSLRCCGLGESEYLLVGPLPPKHNFHLISSWAGICVCIVRPFDHGFPLIVKTVKGEWSVPI